MTIIELINKLNEVPIERQNEEIKVHFWAGSISGYLNTVDLEQDPDADWIHIECESSY